ncbi:MAG: helix-turn-helix transcriptional regulator [bacterium]|nr:helix-turn-helix transcriptional regulator [bacterium]
MKTFKELRLEKGLTLREIAKDIGVTPAFVGQIESGKKKGSIETIISLAKLFNCSIDEMAEIIFLASKSTKSLMRKETNNEQ